MSAREYDLVVFGATGYTGKLCAEHITQALPTDLKWALAGRSESKLKAVAEECRKLNPDRIQPAIEICNLDDSELSALAKKTTVLIATIGPYASYGEYAFRACAQAGTHYLDVTGEVVWVADMIKKYEKSAKESGAIMIPQNGVESAPADLVTWTIVSMIKEKLSAKTREVVFSLHQIKGKPSGGTIATILNILDVYSVRQIATANSPYAISPLPGPKSSNPSSWITRLFGVRTVPQLGGLVTTSIAASADTPIVQRSWGLLGGNQFYGPNFYFNGFMKTGNYLSGVLLHFGLMLGAIMLAISPVRQLVKKYVYQPGDGPTKEEVRKDRVEYRAIGHPDVQNSKSSQAFCKATFEGSLYTLTGIFLAEAAMTILKDRLDLSGGVYTPACLGQKYIDRLHGAGFKFEKKFLEH